MITTITGKNQVTLPAGIVRTLELIPGTQLEWAVGPNGTLIATPRPTKARLASALMGAGRKYLRPGSDPVGDLIAERAEAATAEILDAPLVSWDEELIRRAGAVTPTDWLAANP